MDCVDCAFYGIVCIMAGLAPISVSGGSCIFVARYRQLRAALQSKYG